MGAFVLFSLAFLVASFAASWWARTLTGQSRSMALATEVPLRQLNEDAASVAGEMGPGSFREMVRIRGRLVCESPLVAELSHKPCVSYRFSVTREYEEVLWERDAHGNSVQKLRRRSEVVASNEATTSFWLDDGTGRIRVQPDRATIDRIKSHSSFQPVQSLGANLVLGSFALNVGAAPGGTLGYRYEEEILPLDQEVTVVAEAGDAGGQLALRHPEAAGNRFVITTLRLQDLVRKNQSSAAVFKGVSIGLAAVAVLIFLLGVVR